MTSVARVVCVFWALSLGPSLGWSEEDVAPAPPVRHLPRSACAPSGLALGGELPL